MLGTYLLLSAIPFLSIAFGNSIVNAYQLAGAEVMAWVTIWAIFKRPAWFHWLLIPAFIAVPVQLYLSAYYRQDISAHHLGIIFETSPKEALEFLGSRLWLLGLVALVVIAWFASSWRAACNTRDLDWEDRSRWIIFTGLAIGYGIWLYGQSIGVAEAEPALPSIAATSSPSVVPAGSEVAAEGTAPVDSGAAAPPPSTAITGSLPQLPGWAAPPLDAILFGKSWPFGLVIPAYEFWKERKYLSELAERSKSFRFGARQETASDRPQVVIMVLGESSRFDRWSLNGYKRETTPLLKKEANLVSLADMVTAVSATRLSVPVILSRKPATQS
ncbi:MAG: sulfatase-like hydrolase/transferase, partial [Lacisediminimonas sp.]|nr:sulfatase-like hydrolase/transferase [Lacisediminimonas sp.]